MKTKKYFAVVFDTELTPDCEDYTEGYKYKFNVFAEELEALVKRYDGRLAAVDSWGKIEED